MELKPRTWLAPGAAALVALILSLLVVSTGTWSVFDEYTHFDYVVKVGDDLALPPVNDLLGQQAMRAAVCDSAPGFGALSPSCAAEILDTTRGPYGGQSTATGYLPTYYVATGLGARALVALPGDLSWLHASRIMGSIYLAIAAMLLVGVARRLGASSWISFGFALIASSMPMVLLQFSTVNNDQLAVVLGLAAVYSFLALRSYSRRLQWPVAFGLSLLAMTVKETALVAVVAVLALAVASVARPWRWSPVLLALVAAGVAVVVPFAIRSFAYPVIVGVITDNGMQNDAITAAQGTPPINLVFANALRLIAVVFEVPETFLAGAWFGVAAMIAALLAFGLPLAAVLRVARPVGLLVPKVVLAVCVVVFPVLFIAGFLLLLRATGLPLFFQARYLLPVALLGLAVAAAFVRPWWARVLVPVAGAFVVTVGIAAATAPSWTG